MLDSYHNWHHSYSDWLSRSVYGGFYAIPAWAVGLAAIVLTIGVICLVLGIVLLIALYVRGKMGTPAK